MTTLAPEPFLRGNVFPACDGVPYPRVAPTDRHRVPGGTWDAATVPAGVRLEIEGDAAAVAIEYVTATDEAGIRGDGGRVFDAWSGDDHIDRVPVHGFGHGRAEVRLAPRAGTATVHLPEVLQPTILSLHPVGGDIVPGPPRPRWVAYGDSILEGWAASAPATAWAARVARTRQLDLANLGYAGAARGEIASAEAVAALDAAVVTISYGTNCWSTIPHSDAMLEVGLDAFLTIVRQGHVETPVVVVSPLLRPDAENTPNRLGATLGSLRAAMERVVETRIAGGDHNLLLVEGKGIVDETLLVDGIHPGDRGHSVLAQVVGDVIGRVLAPTPAPGG